MFSPGYLSFVSFIEFPLVQVCPVTKEASFVCLKMSFTLILKSILSGQSPGWQAASFSVLKRLFHCLLAPMLSLGSQSVFLSLFSCKPPSVLVGSSVVPTLQSFLPEKAHVSLFAAASKSQCSPGKAAKGSSITLCTLPCLLVPVVHEQPMLFLEGDFFCHGLPPPCRKWDGFK